MLIRFLQRKFSSVFNPMAQRSRAKKRIHVKIVDETAEKEKASTSETVPDVRVAPPDHWEQVYANIIKMRENKDAPVDTLGCERVHDVDAIPKVQRFQCLVGLMLSSQTKDEVTHAAVARLRREGLTVPNILKMDDKKLGELIYPVGFWRKKVTYLKKTCEILARDYNEDIPDSVEELCKLPGVGPKMAYLCMNIAWKKQCGIGVDTHVHRIANRLGWTLKPGGTKTPEETRIQLQKWLPEDKWTEVNWLLVGFGQQICTPTSPYCGDCLNNQLCPFGIQHLKSGKARQSNSSYSSPSKKQKKS